MTAQYAAAVVALVLAYLLGSLAGSLLLGRLLGKEDLRRSGSGNAGATNALRTGGHGFGLGVLAFDLAKGVLVTAFLPLLAPLPWLAYACGAAAVLGHVYPVFYGFAGGKGAATLIGVLLIVAPKALLPGLAVWLVCLGLTGYVGLSTVLGMAAVATALVLRLGLWPPEPAVVFGLAMLVLTVYTHRDNLRRTFAGDENRFQRAMLLRRRR
jgi:glycerol-3-phosphate acyltransferase PlsY